jgi:hypothetical protein
MKAVGLEVVGLLRRPTGARRWTVEGPEAATMAELLVLAGYTADEAKRIQVLIDGAAVSTAAVPADGAKVTLYLPVGGG